MPIKTTTSKKVATSVKKVAKATSVKAVTKKAPAKKTAVKTATKATVPKPKRAAKAMKSAGLICAPDDQCFWTTDGQILKSLEDLVFAFGSMDETVFVYHANEHKNDFAEWVEHVLADAACAEDLRKTTSKKRAHTVAKKHLKKALS